MTAQLNTYLSLLSYNSSPGQVIAPLPLPVTILPISPTKFQINPFIEKVVLDPYKTSSLNVLSQAELAIDDVIDYLSSVLPTELINEFNMLPDLAEYLLKQGTTLESAVAGLVSQLPNGFSLTALFRAVPIMSVLQNIGSFVGAVVNAGLSIVSLPASFIINGLSYMAKITSSIVNGALVLAEGVASFGINTVLGVTSAVISPIASLAVTLASIATLAVSAVSTVSVLAAVGIGSAYSMVALVNNIGSVNWAVVGNGILMAGAEIGSYIVSDAINYGVASMLSALGIITASGYINDYGYAAEVMLDIGDGYAIELYTSLQTNSAIITAVAGYMALIPPDVSTGLVNAVYINGQSNSVEIISIISEYDINNVLSVLSQVATLGVTGYEAIDPSNYYIDLLNAVNTYGLTSVEEIAYAIHGLTQSVTIDFVNKINTLGNITATLLTTIATRTTPAILQSSIATLSLGNQSNLYIALNQITTLGASKVLHLVNAVKKMQAANVTTFVTILDKVDLPNLLPNVNAISTLSAADVLTIGTHISNNEPYTILVNAGLSDIYLNYAIKQSTEAASLSGNYHMVTNLLNNYTGIITPDYRKYLINNLLANYTTNIDDTTLGPNLASLYFLNALNSIYSNWQYAFRNGINIYNQVPWETASGDALNLLVYQSDTAVQAQLQKDLKYIASN